MRNRRSRPFDILATGELLIDFISTDFAAKLDDVRTFKRLLGGSPASMVMNMVRLGNTALLAATVGEDDMGKWLYREVEALGVDCRLLRRIEEPTTLILVTRSQEVSNFEAYRAADSHILADQLPVELLAEVSILHTTCFGLSRKPARDHILAAAVKATELGCRLSIDLNYARKIWPDVEEARSIVARYCELGALVKISEVDWFRLYGEPLKEMEAAGQHFLDLGAQEVCMTLGAEGAYAASAAGATGFLPARRVEIKDTTGAGDAFWSGYLTAWLDGRELIDRLKAGRRMAELKLGHFGPLPRQIDRKLVYVDLEEPT